MTEAEDAIRVCEDKGFTSPEDILVAAELAKEENPQNDPQYFMPPGVHLSNTPLDEVDMAAITGKKWRAGRTLRVLFLDGVPNVQSKVKEYAQRLETYANINFVFGSNPDAEIRISFKTPLGSSWSYMGTDALHPSLGGKPTMNYGWLTPESTDKEYSGVVLHEFCHALACVHEHQHPEAHISWNKPAVYRYYEQLGWSKEQVDSNIFDKYSMTITQFSAYDRYSIMHYPIPEAHVTNPNHAVGWNAQLSPTDKQYLKQRLYPF